MTLNKARLIAALASLAGAAAVGTAAVLYDFTGRQEGTVYAVYRDAIGVLTSCKGHTGPELQMGMVFSKAECDEQFYADLTTHVEGMAECVKVDLTPGEAVAYVDLAFNIGVKAFCSSTLVRLLNHDQRWAACAELGKWVKAGGMTLRGLVRRRAEERTYCEKDLA